ncbi:unnamed protein product [Pleuronectes platessa]|uniref:Uncharacterized protein n=1 Tax=Pleuronectes platessa TaxID=8262 RepID=A0A9N7YPG8_PLEPL|nr:unnamed protein product [Pleuronectes platessa]
MLTYVSRFRERLHEACSIARKSFSVAQHEATSSQRHTAHVDSLGTVFQRLADASLTLNMAKYEFGKASVTYLGKQGPEGGALGQDASEVTRGRSIMAAHLSPL